MLGNSGGGSAHPKHEKSVLENPDVLLEDKGPHCKHCAGLPGPCKSNMWKSETGLTVCMDYLHSTGHCPHGFKDCFNRTFGRAHVSFISSIIHRHALSFCTSSPFSSNIFTFVVVVVDAWGGKVKTGRHVKVHAHVMTRQEKEEQLLKELHQLKKIRGGKKR
jgi:hypothetical protein